MSDTKTQSPLVSIIVNCHNGEPFLRECLDSIYAQTYSRWEIIFWDNASSDNSASIAKSYDDRLRYCHSDTYITLGEARNKALLEARGQYIAFLDCDDKWLPDKTEQQVFLLERNSSFDFVYSNYFRLVMPCVDTLRVGLKKNQPEGDVFYQFLYHYPVNLQTVMLRKSSIDKLNIHFDERLELSEEFDFFMHILANAKALYIKRPLAIYRIHKDMGSRKFFYKYPQETSYVLDKLKRLKPYDDKEQRKSFDFFEAKIAFWLLKSASTNAEMIQARKKLKNHIFIGLQFLFLYALSFFPVVLKKRFLPV